MFEEVETASNSNKIEQQARQAKADEVQWSLTTVNKKYRLFVNY